MASREKRRTWLKVIGYPLFFLMVFVPSFLATFPLNRVKARAIAEAEKRLKRKIDVASLETTFTGGVVAEGLVIYGKGVSRSNPVFTVPKLTARLAVLPLFAGRIAIHAVAELFGGEVSCTFSGKGRDKLVDLSWSDVDLKKTKPLQDYLGVEMKGMSRGNVSIELPGGKVSKASGGVELNVDDAAILGGKVKGFKLPPIKLGDLHWRADLEKGRLLLKEVKAESDDLTFKADGSVTLSERLDFSRLNLKTVFSFSDKFLSKNKAIKGGLSLLKRAKNKDGKYGYRITGSLRRPIPRPWRR